MRLRKAVSDLLRWERVCRVATVDRTGRPHVTPVCQVVRDGKIYFAVGRDSRKAANLRQTPHVAVLVDLYSEEWGRLAGALVQGRAALIERGPAFRSIRTLLYEKYPQYPEESAIEVGDSLVVEVTPERVASWGLE